MQNLIHVLTAVDIAEKAMEAQNVHTFWQSLGMAEKLSCVLLLILVVSWAKMRL